MHRGAKAHISLAAIRNNLAAVRSYAAGAAVYAVVKADAYGHGSVEVSKALIAAGAERLAVAFCDEAAPLREAGIRKPIIVLFDPDPEDVFRYSLIPVVSDIRSAELLSKGALARDIKLPLHVKVDTGMGRLGIFGDAEKSILEIAGLKNITVEGLMSHLSESEAADHEFSNLQVSRLAGLRLQLESRGLVIPYCHTANSGGIINLPEALFDAVRPGLMLYGYAPGRLQADRLIPAMQLTSHIVSLRRVAAGSPISYNRTFVTKRDSLIGVVSMGYADGYSVGFSNNGEILVKGRRVPVIGRVCMDLTMVDLTDIPGVTESNEVVVLGRQGRECITATELAARINTHAYEILTSLGSRARRYYI